MKAVHMTVGRLLVMGVGGLLNHMDTQEVGPPRVWKEDIDEVFFSL